MTKRLVGFGAALMTAVSAPAHADDDGGFYIGANGGASFASDSEYSALSATTPYDTGFVVSGVVGYEFAKQDWGNIRTELEGFYSEDSISSDGLIGAADGEVSNAGAMLNVYYDMSQLDSRFTPFVGAGIGFSNVDLNTQGGNFAIDDDETVLSYQAIIGVRYEFDDHWSMSVDGRYVGVEDPEFSAASDGMMLATDYEYDSVRATVGLRYKF
ncbi:MAG: OmpW family outer membrane protein [Parvularculaceae bacterium]